MLRSTTPGLRATSPAAGEEQFRVVKGRGVQRAEDSHAARRPSSGRNHVLLRRCVSSLIIFWWVTRDGHRKAVQLPKGTTVDTVKKGPLQITVKADKTVYVGDNVVHREGLAAELRRRSNETSRPVLVRADKSLPYGEVVEVLDACRAAGFENVGLAADRK